MSIQFLEKKSRSVKVKLKHFQDYFVKFKDFKALNLVQSNSKLFKTFNALYGP